MVGTARRAPLPTLRIPSFPAQRRQSDPGGVEAAIDGENLPGDVACAVATQEKYRLRQFLFEAVTIERNGAVIVGADFRRVHGFGQRRLDPAWRNRVDANAERGQLDGELL